MACFAIKQCTKKNFTTIFMVQNYLQISKMNTNENKLTFFATLPEENLNQRKGSIFNSFLRLFSTNSGLYTSINK